MGRGKTHHKPHVWGKPAPYLEFPVGSKEYAILRARENENERERELEKRREVNRSPPRGRVMQGR
jgi:hypothetical protein